jgi:hypothetical protein
MEGNIPYYDPYNVSQSQLTTCAPDAPHIAQYAVIMVPQDPTGLTYGQFEVRMALIESA